ncbi:MAG: DEAD/DEAH box helicase [Nakamurella sp.]
MARSAAEAAPGESWRDALRGYVPSVDSHADTEPEPTNAPTPAALQFELRELIPRSTTRWNGPVSKSAKAVTGELRKTHRLGVRPVARTSRGWARSGITWTNIPHLVNRLNLDPEQHRWFCEFGALHQALKPTTPGRDPDWIYLDDFANPVLWTLLDQTSTLGIQLVGSGAGAAVRRASNATLTLDAGRDQGGSHVGPRLIIDNNKADETHAAAIGTHGIYLVDPATPRQILLARTSETLTPDQLAILANGSTTTQVPEQDVDDFFENYLPDLQERIDITSSDTSVKLPPPAPPVLIVTVTHSPRHTIALAWRWQTSRRSGPPPPLDELLPEGLLPAEWLGPDSVNTGSDNTEDAVPRTIPLPATLKGIDAAEFAAKTLRTLRTLPGVTVESHGTAPDYRELTGTPQLKITTVPSEKHDWFDLGVTVTVDGRTIPFLPLFKALAKGRRRLLLVDGSYLSLNHPSLKALSDLIEESRDLTEWEPVPSISRHQLSLWSDFEDLADEAVPAVEWRALLAETRNDSPRPVASPMGLEATLRPYQQDGFDWLAYLWRHRLGGILADDMGLGKTVQCLTLIQHIRESRSTALQQPFLVVAPTSVVPNWVSEAQRFTPGLTIRQMSTTEAAGKTTIADTARDADIVVTSYALLRLDFDAYQAVAQSSGWAGLVLDEAQFVKNPASKVHAAALDLQVRFKLAVTGTPLENSLTDLQALFAIVAPGLFASAPRFLNDYVRPIEQSRPGIARGIGAGNTEQVNAATRAERLAKLRRRIRPFLLRRTKELVAAELPAKQEQTLRIELAPEHRDLYDLFLQRERQKLFRLLGDDMNLNKFIVFRSLTLLRLLALDASLIGDEYADMPSSKLDALFEQLDDVVAEGHRALVFSQFTSYLAKVRRSLDAAGITYVYLDGSTRNRAEVIEEFKTGSAPVFLISLKAGGFGLNLTEADYVFLLDPWWNPASEEQAIDRTHRIGQDKNVMVYRLVAADTIEEKVLALQKRKAGLFDAVIDDEALFSATLSADDIRELLA